MSSTCAPDGPAPLDARAGAIPSKHPLAAPDLRSPQASTSGSIDDWHAPPSGTPSLRALTLALLPREYESRFWESPALQRSVIFSDKWAAATLLVTNCLYLRWQVREGGGTVLGLWCAALLACSLLQALWLLTAAPHGYLRFRSRTLLCSRLLRLCHAAFLVWRSRMHGHGKPHALPGAPPRHTPGQAAPPAPLDALRLAMHASGASLAFFPAAVAPLPFLLQMPVQLAYLALMLCFNHPVALLLMRRLVPDDSILALCSSLNWVLEVVAMAYLGTAPGAGYLDQQCQEQGLDMVLLFVILYIGVAVPVYIAYCIEWNQKAEFLHELQGREDRPPGAAGAANARLGGWLLLGAPWQALAAAMLGAQCWLATALLAPHLHHVVVPVHAPGG